MQPKQTTGGFLNTSITSPHVTDRRINQQKTQFVPCTLSIIMNSKFDSVDSHFSFQNYQLHNVILLGYIVSVKQSASFIVYEFNDGTCNENISVKKWLQDKNNDLEKLAFCRENCFVRIFGDVRKDPEDEKRMINAFTITPLESSNEIPYHILDVIHTHLLLPRLQMGESFEFKSNFDQKNDSSHFGGNFANSNINKGLFKGPGTKENQNNPNESSGLDTISKQIMDIAKQTPSGPEGLHISELMKKMPKLGEKVIRDKLRYLHEEGHIYFTISDDNFYATS